MRKTGQKILRGVNLTKAEKLMLNICVYQFTLKYLPLRICIPYAKVTGFQIIDHMIFDHDFYHYGSFVAYFWSYLQFFYGSIIDLYLDDNA